MREEIALLQKSVDGQLPLTPGGSQSAAVEAKLVAENVKLRELLEKAKTQISAQQNAPPIPPGAANGVDTARVKELEDLLSSRNATISAQAAEIASLQVR